MSGPVSEVKPLRYAEDLDLVDRAVSGDAAAVRDFQDNYRPMLERVLMSRGVDRLQAEDLVADVIAECFGAGKNGKTRPLIEKFEGRSSLSTWMIRITWNRWLDLKRRDKFRGELPSYDEDDEGYAPYVEVFPMDDVEGDIGGETATQSASVCAHVCIDSSVTADTWDDGSKQDHETGVRRARFDSRLFELVNLIRAEVCKDGHGAVYSTQKTTYDGMTAYPVCYASIIADFRQVASW